MILQWDTGRQLSGYSKMLLAGSKLLKFDVYLIRIPVGVSVPEHTDPATEGHEHHRLNVAIRRPWGDARQMKIKGPMKTFLGGRAVLFRPDLHPHSMDGGLVSSESSLYLLSVGWLRKAKHG